MSDKNKGSMYERYPDYRVDLSPHPQRVVVRLGDAVLAQSDHALLVAETGHEPVVYFPREDVAMKLLERTGHRTFCPFKGEAAYWTIRTATRSEENAVWTYEDPFDQVADLKNFVSFYVGRGGIEQSMEERGPG